MENRTGIGSGNGWAVLWGHFGDAGFRGQAKILSKFTPDHPKNGGPPGRWWGKTPFFLGPRGEKLRCFFSGGSFHFSFIYFSPRGGGERNRVFVIEAKCFNPVIG